MPRPKLVSKLAGAGVPVTASVPEPKNVANPPELPEEAKAYGIIDEIFVGKDSLISIAKATEEKEPKETKERVPVAAR